MIGQHMERQADGKFILKNDDVSLLGHCVENASTELAMFESESLMNMIDFKWERFGFTHHLVGFLIHILQIFLVIAYVQVVYLDNKLWKKDLPDAETNPQY